jgi:PTS system mannose-specific IIB component
VDIKEINLGSMAHSLGKVAVNKVLSMDMDDVKTLEALKDKGITFDVRKVPADSKDNLDALIAKAKAELK